MTDVKVDRCSTTWLVIAEHIAKEIDRAQRRLETDGTSHDDTQFERGRIRTLRNILKLGEAPAPSTEIRSDTTPVDHFLGH